MRLPLTGSCIALLWWLVPAASPAADTPTAQRPWTATARVRAAAPSGRVEFAIKVPARVGHTSTAGRRIAPLYISASTQSVSIVTDGMSPVVANINPARSIIVEFRAPVGTHTFTVSAYDRLGGLGNVLSTGTTPPVTVPVVGAVHVALTLGGVPAKITLSLDATHATVGYPALINLRVFAQDAGGNIMLGGTPFAQPVTLTSSDPVAGALSTSALTQAVDDVNDPIGSAPVGVMYNGANVGALTFSASGPGVQSVTPAVLTLLPAPPSGRQLIAGGAYYAPSSTIAVTAGNQFLGTFGPAPQSVPLEPPFYGTIGIAVDAVAGRLYSLDRRYEQTPNGMILRGTFDIFATSRGYPLIDSFSPGVGSYIESAAIDPGTKTLFETDGYSGIKAFSTAPGHAPLGSFDQPRTLWSLAVDPVAHRLYAAGFSQTFVGGLVEIFSSVPPFALLGTITAQGFFYNCAVDPIGHRLYASEGSTPGGSLIDVYDTSSLNRQSQFGPVALFDIGSMTIDVTGRRMYTVEASMLDYSPTTIEAYAIDPTLARIGPVPSLPGAGAGSGIVIAPYAP